MADAELMDADLRGAELANADLTMANLSGANLGGVNLRGADLSLADLRGADMTNADLRGTIMFGVDLRGADLHGAIIQINTDLDVALYDSSTELPTGFDPAAAGMMLTECAPPGEEDLEATENEESLLVVI